MVNLRLLRTCLAHYLLDGHHKVFAANKAGLPITLLAFLAVEQGISSAEQIEQKMKVIARSNNRVEKDAADRASQPKR